eukprot:CAMPEP_0198564304 /NCGR_PEP_ID=MMETSP1462-20131121/100079_1 /TAXON_ID=1333877 /ORGANISM="Brandtodinium nutriculum, Strain RCC3387" /LENGTH=142 /DNA_ID=CAMNT_0044295275 /DNA_START=35 /DNA_END=460 /DNA_ORIENTATION=+
MTYNEMRCWVAWVLCAVCLFAGASLVMLISPGHVPDLSALSFQMGAPAAPLQALVDNLTAQLEEQGRKDRGHAAALVELIEKLRAEREEEFEGDRGEEDEEDGAHEGNSSSTGNASGERRPTTLDVISQLDDLAKAMARAEA